MRPTTGTMLQQNNNNNYPCLNVTGSTREMLQKCSRASLPFPSRMELGLGDLPLIRGLRAWALCSKNRRKPGGLLGGGQPPIAPPAGHGESTSCPRPADVYLSGDWGRMGYGLPLGLDGGQAGIGALVTVASLKTSEGSGKTQTQCLFLRTEKGSCLYSTAKPGSGLNTSAASSVVGGWLRGKTGGGRDTQSGRRDNGPTPPVQTGANRVRVRSGRRWRKSCNAAGREKTGVSRERRQSRREDPAGELILEERQEEGDKGGLDIKQPPSLQQDDRRACRSSQCCLDSPKSCTKCGRRAQRQARENEHQRGESPRGGIQNQLNCEEKDMRKERQKNEEEEEKEEEVQSSDSVLAELNPDLESNHFPPETHSDGDVQEMREAESDEKSSHNKDDCSDKKEDNGCEDSITHAGYRDFIPGQSGKMTDGFTSKQDIDFNDRKSFELCCEEAASDTCRLSDHVEAQEETEKATVDVKEEEKSISQTPAVIVSHYSEDVSVSSCPGVCPKPSSPVEGSTCTAQGDNKSSKDQQEGVDDPGMMIREEVDVAFEQKDPNCDAVNKNRTPQFLFQDSENCSQLEGRGPSSSPLRHGDPCISETDRRTVTQNSCFRGDFTDEPVWEHSDEENKDEGVNPREKDEGREILKRESSCSVDDFHRRDEGDRDSEDDLNKSTKHEDQNEVVTRNSALKHDWRPQESEDGGRWSETEAGDTCGQTSITQENRETSTSVTNVPCADPPTSITLLLANPAPSLPPLGSMATGLPCLEAEREVEEEEEEEKEEREGVGLTVEDAEGGQDGKRTNGRELKEQGEEERGSTVATEEGRKEEEEEEEDEFGVFMQAEGEPAWSEGSSMSASVPCGSRESVALEPHVISGDSSHWTPGWTDSSFHQSDDTWTAFPQDSSDKGGDVVGQWWPTSAVEQSRERLLAKQNLASVFAEAFPLPPALSSCDLHTVPTLTQILSGGADQDQDQGLLSSFHDLNKMICQRYKRASGVSRDLLLKTLNLEQPLLTEVRPAPWTATRRLSPGLPSANQHAQNAAAKRRLSYDYNRNVLE